MQRIIVFNKIGNSVFASKGHIAGIIGTVCFLSLFFLAISSLNESAIFLQTPFDIKRTMLKIKIPSANKVQMKCVKLDVWKAI